MEENPEEIQIEEGEEETEHLEEQEENNDNNEEEEEVRDPIPQQVGRLIDGPFNLGPISQDFSVSDIKPGEHLKKIEKYLCSYIYDIFIKAFDKEFEQKLTFYNILTKTGFLSILFLLIQFLQILSLVMPPSLIWSLDTIPFVYIFSFLRTFKIQYLFMDVEISSTLGEWLNFYIPNIISYSFIIVLFTLFIITINFRVKAIVKVLHVVILFNQAMYIPILSTLLSSIFCFNNDVHEEILPESCLDLQHFAFFIIGIVLVVPYVLISLAISWFYHEWRPNTPNWDARPHSRFHICMTLIVTAMVLCFHFFELFSILMLFINFFFVLIFVCVHIYFLQWYSRIINQIVCSFLFIIMFGNMISILLTTFKLMLPYLVHSFTNFPGLLFLTSTMIAAFAGTLLTRLRFRVIGLTVNSLSAPRLFQMFYRLQPDEVVVPKGDFEVEMAARTAGVFSLSIDKLNSAEQAEIELNADYEEDDDEVGFSEAINSDKYKRKAGRKLIERIHTLYSNSLDVGIGDTAYISLSYSLIHAFVMKDYQRAITILDSSRIDKSLIWPDMRVMYYVRLMYYVEIEKIVGENRKKLLEKKKKELLENINLSSRERQNEEVEGEREIEITED